MKKPIFCMSACVVLLFALCLPALASDGTRHWWDAFSWFGDIFNYIKSLVVPAENYFHDQLGLISGLLNDRLGGVGHIYQILHRFFTDLSGVPSVGMIVKIPDNLLFQGYSGIQFDFLTSSRPYINLMRSILTTSFCMFTAISCYHHLRTFFTESK